MFEKELKLPTTPELITALKYIFKNDDRFGLILEMNDKFLKMKEDITLSDRMMIVKYLDQNYEPTLFG